jgi:hypothetical protein
MPRPWAGEYLKIQGQISGGGGFVNRCIWWRGFLRGRGSHDVLLSQLSSGSCGRVYACGFRRWLKQKAGGGVPRRRYRSE